jgi:hypothetical protein
MLLEGRCNLLEHKSFSIVTSFHAAQSRSRLRNFILDWVVGFLLSSHASYKAEVFCADR